MTDYITLEASDGHSLQAYVAHPEGTPRATVIVLQEVFGVTDHIREVTREYAAEGYLAIAPCLFDRIRPGMDLAYDDFETAMDARAKSDTDNNMRDIAAAADFGRQAGKVFVVGYCWGGSLAYWAACRLGVDAASSYYGISIADSLDEQPGCPVVYHFGEVDAMTPPDHVAAVRAGVPDGDTMVHVYPEADHGFNCTGRPQFDEAAATLAKERTLKLFADCL